MYANVQTATPATIQNIQIQVPSAKDSVNNNIGSKKKSLNNITEIPNDVINVSIKIFIHQCSPYLILLIGLIFFYMEKYLLAKNLYEWNTIFF